MSIQQFSRGRVAYGSGSYAPTRGQVSAQGAQGYLKRELRKNTKQGVSSYGGDGMSDTRSGVAAAALRLKNKGGASWGATNSGKPQTPNPGRTYELPDESGMGDWRKDQPGGGTPATGGGNPETPNVQIGANGQLELPYNANWNSTVLSSLGDYNSQLLDLQTQRQQQALDFMNQNRQADQDYTNLKRDTLSQSAGAGTAFSSGYGLAVGNNANAYNTFKNQLASQNALANNSFDLQQSSIVDNFNNILRQGALGLADETAQNAGSLGFGTTTPPTGGPKGGNNNGKGPKGDPKPVKGGSKPAKWNKAGFDTPWTVGAKAKMKRGRNAS